MHGGEDISTVRGGIRDSPRGLAAMVGLSSPSHSMSVEAFSHPVDDSRSVDALAMLGMLSGSTVVSGDNDLSKSMPSEKRARHE
jgi:hypothetical protein